jgi:predicted transcriptional regulator
MDLTVHLDHETDRQLQARARELGETPDTLVATAVREWLARFRHPRWPDAVRDYEGLPDMPPFEEGRKAMPSPPIDPLA